MNKHSIRAALLQQRKSLAATTLARNSHQIVQHIKSSDLWQQAQHIALYMPLNGEVDLTELLSTDHKTLYLPTIKDQAMQFQRYHDDLPLKQHRFGVIQPVFDPELAAPQLDLCLLPLVGFDLSGNRLGMGGGYYDRYFDNNNNQTMLAGVAHQFQKMPALPVDSWDVKLHHLFTEQGHLPL